MCKRAASHCRVHWSRSTAASTARIVLCLGRSLSYRSPCERTILPHPFFSLFFFLWFWDVKLLYASEWGGNVAVYDPKHVYFFYGILEKCNAMNIYWLLANTCYGGLGTLLSSDPIPQYRSCLSPMVEPLVSFGRRIVPAQHPVTLQDLST